MCIILHVWIFWHRQVSVEGKMQKVTFLCSFDLLKKSYCMTPCLLGLHWLLLIFALKDKEKNQIKMISLLGMYNFILKKS